MGTAATHRIKRWLIISSALMAVAVAGVAAYLYSGRYNIAADHPHWFITAKLIEMLRDRSIERRAQEIVIPDLEDPKFALRGAGEYAAMCSGCHLAPGVIDSDIREGLYPKPPDLSRDRINPAFAFWTIKHGIKMTAMPAWGRTHDDITLWSIVAFLNKLPGMTPDTYTEMVREAAAREGTTPPVSGIGEHGAHQHGHGGGESSH